MTYYSSKEGMEGEIEIIIKNSLGASEIYQ